MVQSSTQAMGMEFVDYCAHIKNAEIERLQPDVSDRDNSQCFEKASSTVIARNEATKQSRRFPRKNSGLLRLRAMTAKILAHVRLGRMKK
jgi:hypothetical protein